MSVSTSKERRHAERLINEHGLVAGAKLVPLHPSALKGLATGAYVRPSTVRKFRSFLERKAQPAATEATP